MNIHLNDYTHIHADHLLLVHFLLISKGCFLH